MSRSAPTQGEWRTKGTPSPYRLKDDPYSSHAIVALRLVEGYRRMLLQRRYRVLDVGCAQGFLRSFLPPTEFHIIGIERNPGWATEARRRYDEVLEVDVTTEPLVALSPPVDAVVMADVLEHTPDPEMTMRRILDAYLPSGGDVIISVPNVAHLYVRLNLLVGRFPYADRGILDRTHLRFFTVHSAHALCDKAGVAVERVDATPIPLPLIHPSFGPGGALRAIHALCAKATQLWPSGLAYQIVLSGVARADRGCAKELHERR